MSTIISMQDIRLSLATIADRAENGEQFTVVRNSRPAFRIVPCTIYPDSAERPTNRPVLTIREMRARLSSTPSARQLGAQDIDDAIREVRSQRQRGAG